MNDMTLNWYKSIKNRTSVREFSDTVDQKTFTELKEFAAAFKGRGSEIHFFGLRQSCRNKRFCGSHNKEGQQIHGRLYRRGICS